MGADGGAAVAWLRIGTGRDCADRHAPAIRELLAAARLSRRQGVESRSSQVAEDAAGDATVVWYGLDGSNYIVEAATVTDGMPSAPAKLSAAGQKAFFPTVAMNERGDTVVAWTRGEGANGIVQASFRPAGGSFGAPVNLSAGGEYRIKGRDRRGRRCHGRLGSEQRQPGTRGRGHPPAATGSFSAAGGALQRSRIRDPPVRGDERRGRHSRHLGQSHGSGRGRSGRSAARRREIRQSRERLRRRSERGDPSGGARRRGDPRRHVDARTRRPIRRRHTVGRLLDGFRSRLRVVVLPASPRIPPATRWSATATR